MNRRHRRNLHRVNPSWDNSVSNRGLPSARMVMVRATMSVARQSPLKWDDAPFDARPFLKSGAPAPFYSSSLGALFGEDCMAVLPFIKDEVADTVFADPPFNLGKQYGSRSNDELTDSAYVVWCKEWIRESCRVLKPGGSLFLYNLPKWNILLGAYLARNWDDFPALDCRRDQRMPSDPRPAAPQPLQPALLLQG